MARAASIWLVVEPDYEGDHVYAAFTVKHECVTFLQRTTSPYAREVLKFADGGHSVAVSRQTEEEFLAANG